MTTSLNVNSSNEFYLIDIKKLHLKTVNTFFLNTNGILVKICHKLDNVKTVSTNLKDSQSHWTTFH